MTSSTLQSPAEETPQTTPSHAIEAENLVKVYGKRRVVDGVSFTVGRGEILGLLGPNGAGKTTTMRILAGYTPANSGRAAIAGFDVKRDSMEARKRIGYLPESAPLYTDMKVAEYLDFMAEVKRCPRHMRRKWVNQATEECGLGDFSRRVIGNLSKGQRQRVGLAQALLGEPDVLILDEPTVGLDPRQIVEIRELIRRMAGQRSVLLSTHILPEVSMVCKKVVVLNAGRIVASGTPDHLVSRAQREVSIRLTIEGNAVRAKELLGKISGVEKVRRLQQSNSTRVDLEVQTSGDSDPRAQISSMLIKNGISLIEIGQFGASLEDVFLAAISLPESAPAEISPAEPSSTASSKAQEA